MFRHLSCKSALAGAVSAFALTVAVAPAWADEPRQFDIEAQPLAKALLAFNEQSGLTVAAPRKLVEGKTAPAVHGEMEPEQALEEILADSGLKFTELPGGAYTITLATADAEQAPSFRVADVAETDTVEPINRRNRDREGEDKKTLDTIVVTGSNIRGITPDSSPLQLFDREDIRRSGAMTTEQFMRQLPQNFGGGNSEYVPNGLPTDITSQTNFSGATGANLRGLGSQGTLTLVNGNRLATSTYYGEAVDLSMIPTSAIERVEVLTDGASAIYGGDAVAGVVNFILRDDYEGAETSVRYGNVTKGTMPEFSASQLLGTAWKGGNILGVYEYYDRGSLTLAERPNLPSLVFPSEDLRKYLDLLPEQTKHSAAVSAHQEITPSLNLSAFGLYSNRDTVINYTQSNETIGNIRTIDTGTENITVGLSADYEISPAWAVSVKGNYSDLSNTNRSLLNSSLAALYTVDSSLWSVDMRANGDLFQIPGGRVKIALGGNFREESFTGELNGNAESDGVRDLSAAYGELYIPLIGEDNALPLIKRLEINASGRYEHYSDFGSTTNPKVGILWSPADGLKIRGSYGTSFAPPAMGRAFSLDRGATVAGYGILSTLLFGSDADPALAGYDMLVLTGTNDNLDPETSTTYTAGLDYDASWGKHNFSTNITWYDVSFEGRLGTTPLPGNASYLFAPTFAYADPDTVPAGTVTFFPTEDEIQSAIASTTQPLYFLLATGTDNIGFINTAGLISNLSSVKTSGLDIQFDYDVETDLGRVSASLNANYIFDFKERAAATTPEVETLNTVYNPVDLHLRGRLGLTRGAFAGNVFVNYTDSYMTSSSSTAQPISSWTTVDLFASYSLDGKGPDWLDQTSFSVSVSNLFDKDPPATINDQSYRLAGYDPANASPVGRYVTVELRKAF